MLVEEQREDPEQGQPSIPSDIAAGTPTKSHRMDDPPNIARADALWIALKRKIPARFSLGLSIWLICLGQRLVSVSLRYREETDAFKWEGFFLKLRDRCNVLGVEHESSTESRLRRDWGGNEQEYLVCVDLYRYNISVGSDPRTVLSGVDRVQRAETECEASSVDLEHRTAGRFAVDDQVDCWRPRKDISNIYVYGHGGSCGQSICSLAHIYSCSAMDCVQLTTPAEEFASCFGGDAAWTALGRYFIVAGSAMALVISSVLVFSPKAANFIVARGALTFVAGTFAVLLREAIMTERWLEFFPTKVPLRSPLYIFELLGLQSMIAFFSLTSEIYRTSKGDMWIAYNLFTLLLGQCIACNYIAIVILLFFYSVFMIFTDEIE